MQIAGLVCKSWMPQFSRAKADGNVQRYFENEQMVGIQGVDTRAIVQHIRKAGVMNCIISSEISDIAELSVNVKLLFVESKLRIAFALGASVLGLICLNQEMSKCNFDTTAKFIFKYTLSYKNIKQTKKGCYFW